MLFGLVGCANITGIIDNVINNDNRFTDGPESDIDFPLAGGWSGSREPFANEREIFISAMAEFDDLGYEPFLVASQTIGGGFNYTFVANSVPVEPDDEITTIRVHIFLPATGHNINPELEEVWLVQPNDAGRFIGITKLYPIPEIQK
jgi:hypothetical protein